MNTLTTEEILFQAQRCKSAYFWNPGTRAGDRRSNEVRNTFEVAVSFEGSKYTAECTWEESCKHVYARMIYSENGERVTLRKIKKLPLDLVWTPVDEGADDE